jgi:hypothetical protein
MSNMYCILRTRYTYILRMCVFGSMSRFLRGIQDMAIYERPAAQQLPQRIQYLTHISQPPASSSFVESAICHIIRCHIARLNSPIDGAIVLFDRIVANDPVSSCRALYNKPRNEGSLFDFFTPKSSHCRHPRCSNPCSSCIHSFC